MTIAGGETPSVGLARLMFGKDVLASEREPPKRDLLNYCEQDTESMVAPVDALNGY